MMFAIIQRSYGSPEDVLELCDIDVPTIQPHEVLVQVRAAGVGGDDWHHVRGEPYAARIATGLRTPRHRVPGRDVAGRVEAVGAAVTEFRVGDDVFGWCTGAFCEYVAAPQAALALRPTNLTDEQAAVMPTSGLAALQAVRDLGRVRPGDHVLVIGASGGVGVVAVQIAKALGAMVTGVCSTTNGDLVRTIGADHIIDYTRDDFIQQARRYDLIVDMVGDRTLTDLRGALKPDGTLVMVGGTAGRWFSGLQRFVGATVVSAFVRHRLRPLIQRDRIEDLVALRALLQSGKVAPVVSAHYPLAEVSAALRHFAPGHARGKVAITV